MCLSTEEADRMIAARDRNRVLFSVFHNRRWDGDFLTLRDCIASGRLGEVHTFFASRDRFRPEVRQRWKEQDQPGAGTLYDLGSHLIDQALCLFGMPDTVTADIGIQRRGGQATDYFHLVLRHGGVRVILHAGSLVSQPGPRFHVHGSAGSYCKHGEDVQEAALQAGAVPGGPGWGVEPPEAAGILTQPGPQGLPVACRVQTLPGNYLAYYAGVVEALTQGRPVPVSAEEATRVIQVIDAAYRSSREGRTVPLGALTR